jgi:hypothetical protein
MLTNVETGLLWGCSETWVRAWKKERKMWGRPGVTEPQALAGMLYKAMREGGLTPTALKPLVDRLCAMSREELEMHLAEGRTHLMVVGNHVCPRLLSPDAIENPADGVDPKEVARLLEAPIVAIDVASRWKAMLAIVDRMRAKEAERGRLDVGRKRGRRVRPETVSEDAAWN